MFQFWKRKPKPTAPTVPKLPASPPLETRAITRDDLPWESAKPPEAGIPVTVQTALSNPTIFRAVDLLSSTIASLPLPVYDSTTGEKAYDHPVYRLLNTAPNSYQDAYSFRKLLAADGMLHGQSIAIIGRRDGELVSLRRIDPRTVTVRWIVDPATGDIKLTYYGNDPLTYAPFALIQDQVLHTIHFSLCDYLGESPFDLCAESISLSLALDRFAAAYVRNGAVPTGKLDPPEGANNADIKEAREEFKNYEGSTNAGKTFIPPAPGWTWTPMSSNPEQCQMNESRVFQMRESQKVTGVGPAGVYDYERQTWNNIQYARMDFVQNSVRPNIIPFEQQLMRKLFTPQEQDRYFVEHVVEGLLRGSFSEQIAVLTQATAGKPIYTQDEARKLLNLPELGGAAATLEGTQSGPVSPADPTEDSAEDEVDTPATDPAPEEGVNVNPND